MENKRYSTLLFDLDGTLWDFRLNSRLALEETFKKFNLPGNGLSFDRFLDLYHRVNDELWGAYRQGRMDKETLRWQRFARTLHELSPDLEPLARQMDVAYLEFSRQKTNLIPGTIDVLKYLSPKYRLFIVTNGFNEVQFSKIRNSGLEPYFEGIVTSEIAGAMKPDPLFFQYTLNMCQASATECLVIGDDAETDIAGAAQAGIDQVFFIGHRSKGKNQPGTYCISSLKDLTAIL